MSSDESDSYSSARNEDEINDPPQRKVKPMSEICNTKRSRVWQVFGPIMVGDRYEDPAETRAIYCKTCFEIDQHTGHS